MRAGRRLAAIVACLIAWFVPFQPFASGADVSLEFAVKATYLLKFTKFIDWPAPAALPANLSFNICILGNNPFGTTLDQLVSGENVNGRKVVVQKIDKVPTPGTCQMIFFGDEDQAARTLIEVGAGVLTVGQGATFVRDGGMIGFIIEDHRVTFEINRRSAEAAGIKLSSGLLAVAKSVIK